MANTADLVKLIPLSTVKDLSMPLGKTDEESGHDFITKNVVQRLLVHPYTGIMTELPEDVQSFFTTPPQDAFLGEGFVHTRMGTVYPWIMPKAKIGDQYKHIKPADAPVFEEKDKFSMEFQCSQAIRTGKFGEKLDDLATGNKITTLFTGQTKSAIYNLINKLYMTFWCAVTSPLTTPIVFDDIGEELGNKLTGKADGSREKLLQDYQEAFHPYAKAMIDRAARIKNRVWYDPALISNYNIKNENEADIIEVKKPTNLGQDHKSYCKALYVGTDKKTPKTTRDQSIYAQLSVLRRVITELTSSYPRYTNSVEFDTDKGLLAADSKQSCRTTANNLIIMLSSWDRFDLTRGVSLTGLASRGLSLEDVTGGIKVMGCDGIAPGHMYVGEKIILNFFMQLNRVGSVFHYREEETQYYANFWFAIATFTKMVCGKAIAPCKNYRASPEFYAKFSKDITSA